MAKRLETWVETDVQSLEEKSANRWSQFHLIPACPACAGGSYFFSPVDDLIGFQRTDDADFITFGLKQDEAAAHGKRSRAAFSIPKAEGPVTRSRAGEEIACFGDSPPGHQVGWSDRWSTAGADDEPWYTGGFMRLKPKCR